MGRKANIIIYPRLIDYGGDVSRKWYVTYSYRTKEGDSLHRYRVYDGLGTGTAQQRYKVAREMCNKIAEFIKSGEYLKHDYNYMPVRTTDSHRPEHETWNGHQRRYKIFFVVHRFIESHKAFWRDKTRETYSSKLMIFCTYVEKELGNKPVFDITRSDLLPFFDGLAVERKLSKQTIDKYEKIIHALFEYMEESELIPFNTNPVCKIPNRGLPKDLSPDVFTQDDRQRLKEAIEHRSPWLWLACEMQYYCAIRPGQELRLLKVGDVNRMERTITIRAEIAKNRSTQSVGCPSFVLDLMDRMGVFLYPENFYVFGRLGVPGLHPLGKNTMRNRFNEYRDALGISKKKKFYSWKHTGAISRYDNGMPIYELKDHLRHSSIATTEEYLKKHVPKTDNADKYIDVL